MSALSISKLESQLLDNVFPKNQREMQGSQFDLPVMAGTPVQTALQAAQKQMTQYAFRDFVDYFMQLEQRARNYSAMQKAMNPASSSPLVSAGLQLNIEVERFQGVASSELNSAQPVVVQKLQTEQGLASRIEIRTPEVQSDGSVSYSITVIKLAVEMGQLQTSAGGAQGGQTGQLPMAAGSGSVSATFTDFLDKPRFSETAGTAVWDYTTDNAMALMKEQERVDGWIEEQARQAHLEAAYQVMAFLQGQKVGMAFELSKEERELVANALDMSPDEVTRKALINFIKRKRIEMEMLRKELQERQVAAEMAHTLAALQEKLDKLINEFDQMQKELEKNEHVDVEKLRQLMANFDATNLALSALNTMNILGPV
ncbi:MAG: hypothetical protein ACO1RX_07775 [Candidatus Sericytochromatia bacterium]